LGGSGGGGGGGESVGVEVVYLRGVYGECALVGSESGFAIFVFYSFNSEVLDLGGIQLYIKLII
jgi:hypothetical protein